MELLGPLEDIMRREKSPHVVNTRLLKLQAKGTPTSMPGEIHIKRKKRSKNGVETWEIVRAKGHMDEILELRKGGTKIGGAIVTPRN